MLPKDPYEGELSASPVGYIVYGPDGRLVSFNERIGELFPGFIHNDMIGKTREEVRDILRTYEPAAVEALNRLDEISDLSAEDGIFEFGKGRYCALDDLALPDGSTLTLIRDLSEKKRSLDSIARMERALSELANEEAIYDGTKERAYLIMTEVAGKALMATRTDVWLMNVDRTSLYPQESYWSPTGEHMELERLDKEVNPALFEMLAAGEPICVPNVKAVDFLKGVRSGDGREQDIKSILIVPIMRGPRVVGAIAAAEETYEREWRQSEIAFVSYLCDLILRMLEAHDRRVAEEGLRGFNEMLEMKVKKRTRDLEEAMETLKLAQEELVRSEKMASLGGLVAGVAHEINTPLGVALTSITHMAEVLEGFKRMVDTGRIKKSDLTNFMETADEGTTVVCRNLERAAHLVRSFKMVAVDQSADDTREIDVGDYINEIVDSLVPTLRKKGVKVEAEAGGKLMMKTVPGDLSHILTNLIMNAALHGFSDRPDFDDKQIKVTAQAGKKDVIIEVMDNGRGIPEDIREKIFEPFFTTARSTGGSGLGLNIVYNTVYHKLGGSIEVGDAEGGGTRFTIKLPLENRKTA
ncbi:MULTISPECIES: ATP-binding protein [Kordiimonas]|jgi:signal transduction histidine kinase|uniref:ATP-binding protein n=1 Tax=Kordiimonas TaxID=288021 RepID=UPI00257F6F99|nr:ATP-binding protein [Kordiimonas sp. UBA4487]